MAGGFLQKQHKEETMAQQIKKLKEQMQKDETELARLSGDNGDLARTKRLLAKAEGTLAILQGSSPPETSATPSPVGLTKN